eukprot:223257_1
MLKMRNKYSTNFALHWESKIFQMTIYIAWVENIIAIPMTTGVDAYGSHDADDDSLIQMYRDIENANHNDWCAQIVYLFVSLRLFRAIIVHIFRCIYNGTAKKK